MSTDRKNEHDLDRLLKQVLKDDLPSEAEFRMRKRLSVFRRILVSSEYPGMMSGDGTRKPPPAPVRWFARHPLFRKEVLACVSTVMLAAGIVIHLGGYQNVLADSISLLKMSLSISAQIRVAGSMDCVVNLSEAGMQTATYRIRWIRDGRTRVDVASSRGAQETVWIMQGRVTRSSAAAQSAAPVSSLLEPVRAFLLPADLARKLDQSWQLQPGEKHLIHDTLVFVDRQDRSVIEIHFDKSSLLPVSLNRKSPEASRQGGVFGSATAAAFTWNQPVAPELMAPQLKSGR